MKALHLPGREKICAEMRSDLYTQPVREDTLADTCQGAARQIAPASGQVKTQRTAHETATQHDGGGARASGKLNWLHSTRTVRLTPYALPLQQGAQAVTPSTSCPNAPDV